MDFFAAAAPPPDRGSLAPRQGLRLGCSGWSYKDWVGVFYPAKTAQTDWLTSYSEVFDTVEIDSTFYGPPRPETVRSWREKTTEGFLFSAKFPQVISHEKALVGAELETGIFIETMQLLGDKLGPLLLQMPAHFKPTPERKAALLNFAEGLPQGLQYAVELRDDAWFTEDVFTALQAAGVSLAHCDWPGVTPTDRTTAPFVYTRLIGDRELTVFSKPVYDREKELTWWAGRTERLLDLGKKVFLYVNNHYQGHSPHTLRHLRERLRGA